MMMELPNLFLIFLHYHWKSHWKSYESDIRKNTVVKKIGKSKLTRSSPVLKCTKNGQGKTGPYSGVEICFTIFF